MRKLVLQLVLVSSLAAVGALAGTFSITPGAESNVAHAGVLTCDNVIGPEKLVSSCLTWYQRWYISVEDCDAESVTAYIKNGLGATIDTVYLSAPFPGYWYGFTSCLGVDADSITVISSGGDIVEETLVVDSGDCGCSPQ